MAHGGTDDGTPGPSIGPFALRSLIAKGGMAEVWSGVHVAGTPVAVKVLTAEQVRDARFTRALREEIRAAAALTHPGIVTVLDEGEVDAAAARASGGRLVEGSPVLVMEYASGGALDRADLPGSFAALRERLVPLLDALAHAHARGVVHRDLKPGNVLVATEGDLRPGLKLSDFGLAVALDRSPHLGATAGTPAFMAPEQFRGDWRAIGPSTDLYALACIAWFWATHRPMYQGDRRQLARAHQTQALPAFQPKFPVPAGFSEWLQALLHKDPSSRCQRAADAAHALIGLGLPDAFGGGVPASAWHTLMPTLTEVPSSELEVLEPVVPLADRAAPAATLPAPPLPESWALGRAPAFPPALLGAGLGLYGSRAVPMIGRRAERDLLWSALREVSRSARPAAVVLRGAAGTGKTRLARWLCERAEELGAAVALRATHHPHGGASDGLAGMLARHYRVADLTGAELEERLARRLPDGVSPQAASVLLGQEGAVRLSTEDRGALLVRLLRHEARQRPVVVWLDDVQWGADALQLAGRVLRATEPAPVLWVLTVRDEALAERPAERDALEAVQVRPAVRTLPLDGLSAQDCADLLGAHLLLEPRLAAAVASRAGGNPLFAVQLVGDWVARDLMVVGPDGFVLRGGVRPPIPDDLHMLWTSRVDRLVGSDADAARALELAAALGVEVDDGEWRAAAALLDLSVPADLSERLIDAGMAIGRVERWQLAHGLLRESLARRSREAGRWTALHDACAALLADPTTPDPTARGRRARHLLEAGRAALAAPELLRAAEQRVSEGYAAEGLVLLDDWARAVDLLDPDGVDPVRLDGLLLRAEAMFRQESFAYSGELVAPVIEQARREGWPLVQARALRLQAQVAYHTGRLDEADLLYAEARDLYAAADDPDGQIAALCGLGNLARLRGSLERAVHLYAEALTLRPRATQESGVREAMLGLGLSAFRAGDLDLALPHLEEARRWVEASGSPIARVTTLTILGEVAREQGDLAGATGLYREAVEVDRGIGRDTVVPRLNLAMVLVLAGRQAEARPMLEPLLEQARRQRSVAETFVRSVLLVCDAAERRWDAFDEGLAAVIAAVDTTGLVEPDLGRLLHEAGRIARAQGKDDAAQAALGAALKQFRALGREERVAAVRRDLLGDPE